MALINCPECNNLVSDHAKSCPHCGHPIKTEIDIFKKIHINIRDININMKVVISVIIVIFIIAVISIINSNSEDREFYNNYTSYKNNYSYSDSSMNLGKDASSIFHKLQITDFSCDGAWMRCQVKNNNDFTIHGYFYVNFYDSKRHLLYNELMLVTDVASGETITCSDSIPKDKYPDDYTTVDFSPASLSEVK